MAHALGTRGSTPFGTSEMLTADNCATYTIATLSGLHSAPAFRFALDQLLGRVLTPQLYELTSEALAHVSTMLDTAEQQLNGGEVGGTHDLHRAIGTIRYAVRSIKPQFLHRVRRRALRRERRTFTFDDAWFL
jgi:hypothetical protein